MFFWRALTQMQIYVPKGFRKEFVYVGVLCLGMFTSGCLFWDVSIGVFGQFRDIMHLSNNLSSKG